LTMYAVLLIPGLNLLPPFAFFLFLHISYNHFRTRIHTVSHDQVGFDLLSPQSQLSFSLCR
jgi:hypothetical protein